MFNTQVKLYRLVKDGEATEYEDDEYATVMSFIEPAGVTPFAPIDTIIGSPYNIHIRSQVKLGLAEGDKIVNINDDTDIYIVISNVNEYKTRGNYSYECVTYRPKQ